jgi:RNA polymerase sigma factor (sigma-70 family)
MSTDLPSESPETSASPEQRFLDYSRTGNKAIIQALIAEFADRSYTQARRIIGRRDGAEDAVQDAHMRLVHTAKKYDGSVPFAAWLGRLVNAAAVDHRSRRLSRHVNFSDMGDQGVAAMNTQVSDSDNADSPEIEALRTALDDLPESYRTPLTLYYFGGLNQSETAQALGAPAGTIATHLARGLERLRQKLGRAGFAVTSAGLLTLFASLPTYAAPPTLKASFGAVASERFVAAARHVGHHLIGAKKVSAMAAGSGLFKVAAVCVLAITATAIWTSRPDNMFRPALAITQSGGLVGHWTLDETDGLIAADSSGNAFNGTLGNYSTPGWTAGKVGGALDFDGASNYVSMGSPTALTNLTRITLAAWIKPRSFGQLKLGRIVNKRRTENAGWSLFLNDRDEAVLYSTLCFKQAFSITEGAWATPSDSIALDVWQHVALTYDNSSAANRPVFYIKGTRVTTMVETAPSGSASADSETPVLIGNMSSLIETFDGAIDDVRIYNRILSATEIGALATLMPTGTQ